MDKSWRGDASATVRIRTNDTPAERETARASAREARAAERIEAIRHRQQARDAARAESAAAREAARAARRDGERVAAAIDPHSAAARRPRGSGRRDVVRERRDTSGYTTVVDVRRMRELAKRGASASSLAGAFGISQAEVERMLAEADAAGPAAAEAMPAATSLTNS